MYTCQAAIDAVRKDLPDVSIELIDLRTIYPWDRQTVINSVKKTGRCVIVHESMVNFGVGAEVAATIQDKAFGYLRSPVKRVAGLSTHTGLTWEKYALPDVASMSHSREPLQPFVRFYWESANHSIGVYDCVHQLVKMQD